MEQWGSAFLAEQKFLFWKKMYQVFLRMCRLAWEMELWGQVAVFETVPPASKTHEVWITGFELNKLSFQATYALYAVDWTPLYY